MLVILNIFSYHYLDNFQYVGADILEFCLNFSFIALDKIELLGLSL